MYNDFMNDYYLNLQSKAEMTKYFGVEAALSPKGSFARYGNPLV